MEKEESYIKNNTEGKLFDILTEKSDELLIDNNTKEWFNSHIAKQCALIAVDEILKAREVSPGGLILDEDYWLEVKEEIIKL